MRAMIIEAAREVFSRFGYKKATLDDIASSLYKAKSSIYYYFKSKEDVFKAVIDYEGKRADAIIKEAVSNAGSPEEKLATYFRTVKDFIKETINYYMLIQEEMLEVMSFSEEMKHKHKKESADFIAGIIQEGINTGIFADTNAQLTAETLMLAFDGLYSPWYSNVEITDEQFETLISIAMNGIKKH